MKNVETKIKCELLKYGGKCEWVENNIKKLIEEVVVMINSNNVPFTDHNISRAAFLVIDSRY